MTTIREVAQLAGVSVATVSRVINNKGYVKQQTRQQIEHAITQLNYQPNEAARTLFKRKSKMIGLLLPDISNPFFTLIARGVEDIALEQGYQVLIGNSDNDVTKARDYLSTFISHNCVGMITTVIDEHVVENMLSQQGIPFVFVDRTNNERSGISTNHFEGGQRQAELILEGHGKHILIVHADLNIDAFKMRVDGIKAILQQHAVSYHFCNTEQLDEERQFLKMLNQYKIDSVICSNDLLAIKILGLIQQYHFKVPEDIQIVGYDNIPFSKMTYPQITTIDQSAYQLGQLAVSKLLNLYDENSNNQCDNVALIVKRRKSTRF
ncbi:LacI family DNA-binding transcriptional regulator [Staphylococcus succinus]|uniref:LacI family DNA-binding transcriptional regulator n=1 Tax=Staphylococcus succinus TaxID=61015 RepID=UPI002DB70F23|nr:LacI family DNA-binding transcriptional regulator [Staphylococcus succinus]MEB8126460.1 LacI family transcriptional regulator [Staphylococcus succinus]